MLKKIYAALLRFIKDNLFILIGIILVILLTYIKLPYRISMPGGVTNLNKRYQISEKYQVKGSINEAYVSEMKASPLTYVIAKIYDKWDISKNSDFTYSDETYDNYLNRTQKELEESIDTAKIIALKEAGYDIKIDHINILVTYILKDCKNDLKINDEIIALDHHNLTSLSEMKTIINKHQAGDYIDATIMRDGKVIDTKLKIYDYHGNLVLGVFITTKYHYDSPLDIKFKYAKKEHGASGGLMNTLAIYNLITKEDITKGKKIIGTGTIDIDGNVGEIGGVKYKMLGAKKCDIFIIPEENYKEALKVKKKYNLKYQLIKVKTIDDAIKALKEI